MLWGRGQKCKALAGRFVAALNAHDTDALSALVTEDFTYIDSWREGVTGRERKTLPSRSVKHPSPIALVKGGNHAHTDP